MKILTVNYHYFIYGGPDRYFFNLQEVLERGGHTVVPFAFDYEETVDTPYRDYFPEPITGRGPCLLSKLSLSPVAKAKAVCRMFWNPYVDRKFRAIVEAERPDIVFSIFLADSMLPNILHFAKRVYGIPVIYRLSDFHMFCASHLFFRNNVECTECLQRWWAGVTHRCVHGSVVASIFRVLQMQYFRWCRWYDSVDAFVCPSRAMVKRLIENGVPPEKVTHIPTFAMDLGTGTQSYDASQPYALYFGRINREKGSEVILRAFNTLHKPTFRLKMVGHVESNYQSKLLDCLDNEHRGLVDIVVPQQGEELARTVRGALFVVQPSLCVDNMPNAVIEAMSAGKAIIGTNIGGLPELVQHGVNGLLVQPGDVLSLAKAMVHLSCRTESFRMGEQSRMIYEQEHTPKLHISRLMGTFERFLKPAPCCVGLTNGRTRS